MSASEKLERLGQKYDSLVAAELPAGPAYAVNYLGPIANLASDFHNALPEIIAVVKAAEQAVPVVGCFNAEVGWGHCEGITDRGEWERVACSRCRAESALAALDEKLP